MSTAPPLRARPDRIRVALEDNVPADAIELPLPGRTMWPAGVVVAGMFAIFAGIEWIAIRAVPWHPPDDVFNLMFTMFRIFWALGWSVGAALLGVLTLLLLFYSETARLSDGRLTLVPRMGPLKIFVEYDLAKVRDLRLEPPTAESDVRIRFDYNGSTTTLGGAMSRPEAQRLVDIVAGTAPHTTSRDVQIPGMTGDASRVERSAPGRPPAPVEQTTVALDSASTLASIVANLIPLAGVLLFGWDLSNVMMLFWAESGVIALYTALKMAVVGRLMAIVAVPFFIAHFGGFMTMHFLFIYLLFVRGMAPGPLPAVHDALPMVFGPLGIPIAALVISHGVSFWTEFIGRSEYVDAKMSDLMTAPYNRILVMQLALIFGGWIILLLRAPAGALVILVAAKTALDLGAHRRERQRFAKGS